MKIVIGGDVSLMEENSVAELYSKKQTEKLFAPEMLELLRSADEVIVNLECAITDKDTPIHKFGPNLFMPFGTGDVLRDAGVTLCALSNNHIFDFGKAGIKDTMAELQRAGLAYTGYGNDLIDARRDYIIEREGKRIAVIDVCEHEYSYALKNREGAREYDPYDTNDDIVSAKKNADYVIVIYHGGKEYCRYPSPRLLKLCRSMVRHGADVVLCQHTHCISCYEEFEGGHIVYGQGNFHFAYTPDDDIKDMWNEGLAAVVNIDESGLKFELVPTVMESPILRIANAYERDAVLNSLAERNKTIIDGTWYDKWLEFCFNSHQYDGVLDCDNTDLKAHFIDCEAHLDVLRERYKTWNHTNEI